MIFMIPDIEEGVTLLIRTGQAEQAYEHAIKTKRYDLLDLIKRQAPLEV